MWAIARVKYSMHILLSSQTHRYIIRIILCIHHTFLPLRLVKYKLAWHMICPEMLHEYVKAVHMYIILPSQGNLCNKRVTISILHWDNNACCHAMLILHLTITIAPRRPVGSQWPFWITCAGESILEMIYSEPCVNMSKFQTERFADELAMLDSTASAISALTHFGLRMDMRPALSVLTERNHTVVWYYVVIFLITVVTLGKLPWKCIPMVQRHQPPTLTVFVISTG